MAITQQPAPSGDCRLQAMPALAMDPWNGHPTLHHPPTPLSPPLFGYRGATRFALLLFDTQSSLPFNTLRKHIKWKFRARRPAPCFEWVVRGAVGERGWQTPKPCFIVRQPMQSAGICTTHERIFHVTFAKAKQTFTQATQTQKTSKDLATGFARRTACLVVLLFDLCSVLIAHLPLCFFLPFLSRRNPCVNMLPKKIGLQAVLPFQVFYK